MIRYAALVSLLALQVFAATPACVGSLSVGTFRLEVEPHKGGPPLSVRVMNAILPGEKLKYEPIKLPHAEKKKAEIAIVLVPAGSSDDSSKDVVFLEPRPADAPTDWTIPKRTSVVALIYGPHGLNVKKLKSLMNKNEELLTQLADYAQQTERVGALVQALEASERSGGSLSAAMAGFSSQYGVSIPKLDTHAPTDQQASLLLRALMPTVSTYDPLNSQRTAVMQQSAGLAASVASLFFGSPVGLAAGGASLFQNLRSAMFPNTEFRSAFAPLSSPESMELCAKNEPPKSRTRIAYLWAHRVPDEEKPPVVSFTGPVHVPVGLKSNIMLEAAKGVNMRSLNHAHDWQLVSSDSKASYPTKVTVSESNALTLDLTHTKAKPGEYKLAAKWDWSPLEVSGAVNLHALDKLKTARLTVQSQDHLLQGAGPVPVELTGADFEFVEKVAMESASQRESHPTELHFSLPKGKRAGVQESLRTEIDTTGLAHGDYRLLLTQADGLTYEVPIQILPPNPEIADLPLRINVGDTQERIPLRGTGLDRIEQLTTDAGAIQLEAPGRTERAAVIRPRKGLKKGEHFALEMRVQGVHEPIPVEQAITVAGPRPKVVAVRKSLSGDAGVSLREGELPVGSTISFAVSVQNLDSTPTVEVACADSDELREKLTLTPGDRTLGGKPGGAKLDLAGEGLLFLSLDPGAVGRPGCLLTATVTTPTAGASDPQTLGQVVRVPRIEKFELTDEKLGDATYAGILTGRDLETIEMTGWDQNHGLPVQSIPTPVPGDPQEQTLKVALPWPAPEPHAPVFIWLRGETTGRPTGVKY